MDLKQFVAETLGQIAEGVAEAAKTAQASGAVINPTRYGRMEGYHTDTGAKIVDVDFTVALSVNEGTATKGGIGVVAGVFALGTQGHSNETKASTTHVKFSVPMVLPRATKEGGT
jgi:hypothetical protein